MSVRESASTRNTFAPSPGSEAVAAPRVRRLRTWGAVLAAAAVLPVGLLSGCGKPSDDAASAIVRTTTNVAGASVVGLERDTRTACALPSAADSTSGTRAINSTTGTVQVPADPQRIVVLSTPALDAICALGLWERVVGAATVGGVTPQPAYLGTGISEIPGVGMVGNPNPALIADLKPDVIIGAAGDSTSYEALQGIAPTVLVPADGGWQNQFTAIADALGRERAADKVLEDYRIAARETGDAVGSSLTQASVLRFGADGIQVLGDNSFAGQVLADTGVQRPTAQRGDTFDIENVATEYDRDKVEGDLIYVVFNGPEGLEYGESVMRGEDWKSLSAIEDKRNFAVEDTIWHGSGVTAARALLDDVRNTLNGYVTD
ncbi:iron-siderophore ABC transporter substrate-binding protein [Nocardia uniformis]|uniref:Iron-siderophore ABC transporter substrate-binding protein n=1 Tax=Nocardia uniformis TaxID=53432 RepID=A0A849C402_9NOCA|nr:iron-siderophore ABC transporter substrate-binding protein [Nocardia uniformis]NNH72498.1 iron-siderophore ABC transporter substrate-binding protein [Nocardia uniformis]